MPCIWISLLATLAENVTVLKSIELARDAECEFLWPLGYMERGLGGDELFVRALARIKQLEELRIKGLHEKNWPLYLRGEMSAQLHAQCGRYVDRQDKYDEYDEEIAEWARGLDGDNLKNFKAYQEGTENIVPECMLRAPLSMICVGFQPCSLI